MSDASPVAVPVVGPNLRSLPAGYSVVRECLEQQGLARPRSGVARFFGVRPVHQDAQSWFSGAIGEIRIGGLLARLGPEWVVLHSVPVGKSESDIDHVLVGPPGVFTINTKRHAGKKVWVGERALLVAGQPTKHIANARYEAARAEKLLTKALGRSVSVTPLVVLVDIDEITVKQQPKDVVVLTERRLLRWLGKREIALTAADVAQVGAVAAEVRTWHSTAQVELDEQSMVAFAALQKEDRSAYVRRALWAAATAVAVAVVTLQVGSALLAGFLASLSGQ